MVLMLRACTAGVGLALLMDAGVAVLALCNSV